MNMSALGVIAVFLLTQMDIYPSTAIRVSEHGVIPPEMPFLSTRKCVKVG